MAGQISNLSYYSINFDFLYSKYFLIPMGILAGVVCIAAGAYLVRKYKQWQWGTCTSKRRMEGKIIIITGANSGIGKETAQDLASRGAVVIMACRNGSATQEAIKQIRVSTGDGELIYMQLDLADLESIKTFASNFQSKFEKLDVLINNAGLYMLPDQEARTKDGLEIHFGVNHLGHFYLTNLLLDCIKKAENSRIVIVSSLLYTYGNIEFENFCGKKCNMELYHQRKTRNPLYSNSKLCNILFARQLEKHVIGSSTKVFSLTPGFSITPLMRHSSSSIGILTKILLAPLWFFVARSTWQAAQSSLYCAVSEDLDNVQSGFVKNCQLSELQPKGHDDQAAEKLWQFSTYLSEKKDVQTLIDKWQSNQESCTDSG